MDVNKNVFSRNKYYKGNVNQYNYSRRYQIFKKDLDCVLEVG